MVYPLYYYAVISYFRGSPNSRNGPAGLYRSGWERSRQTGRKNSPVTRRLNPTTRFDNLFTSSDVFKYVRLNNETLKN